MTLKGLPAGIKEMWPKQTNTSCGIGTTFIYILSSNFLLIPASKITPIYFPLDNDDSTSYISYHNYKEHIVSVMYLSKKATM